MFGQIKISRAIATDTIIWPTGPLGMVHFATARYRLKFYPPTLQHLGMIPLDLDMSTRYLEYQESGGKPGY